MGYSNTSLSSQCSNKQLFFTPFATFLISLHLLIIPHSNHAFITGPISFIGEQCCTNKRLPVLPHQMHRVRIHSLYRCNLILNKASNTESQDSTSESGDRSIYSNNLNHDDDGEDGSSTTLNIVIVGSGWAGYSVAESLSQNKFIQNSDKKVKIILLDASPNSGGLAGGFKTKTGRNVEAGIHGFWREYKNTFSIMDRVEGVNIDNVLGDYVPSVLYSKNGRVALAPVLGDDHDYEKNMSEEKKKPMPQQLLEDVLLSSSILKAPLRSGGSFTTQIALLNKYLPPPLDIALLAKFNPSSPLKTADRLSALGLLGPWVDFQQESSNSWSIYDQYSARVLFQDKAGITKNLYEELIEPLLSVLPMCPDYDCSAAAILSCFHVFALQSKGAFDVKWCRGSIKEKIFDPWSMQLSSRGIDIRYNSRVTSVVQNDDGDNSKKYCIHLQTQNRAENEINCDAIVFAVGGTAMGRITHNSPALKELRTVQDRDNFDKLRGVTCVAVRLFLQPDEVITSGLEGEYGKTQLPPDLAKAMKDSPIAVCGPNPSIIGEDKMAETGFCIYDLQRMHDEFSVDANIDNSDAVAVLEVDFYRADKFVDMDDQEIAQLALQTVATTFNTKKISMDKLVDVSVVRARNAVSHFAPKSSSYSPGVKLDDGMYICGDWVDRSGHASWSTEKAVVTGIQAATRLSEDFKLENTYSKIIEAAKDTDQLRILRKAAVALRDVAPPPDGGIPPSPWMYAKEIFPWKLL